MAKTKAKAKVASKAKAKAKGSAQTKAPVQPQLAIPAKEELLKKSKIFCMAPWTHLNPNPNGTVTTCCMVPMTKGEVVMGNIHSQNLEQIWNSPRLRQLRLDMLKGNPPLVNCSHCYSREKVGTTSLRTSFNERYGENHFPIVQSTKPDGSVDKFNMVYFDFRFSNVCNLKCRTCGPAFSSSWHDDFVKLPFEFALHDTDKKVQRFVENPDNFWPDFEKTLDKVEYIHFAGGEPMVQEEHYKVLDLLMKKKKFDIELHYSTNATILKYRNYDLSKIWSHFKRVHLSLSIDAIGPQFEFLRKNADWESVEHNLKTLKQNKLPNLTYWFHPTISIFNIARLPEMHEHWLKQGYVVPGQFGPVDLYWGHEVLLNILHDPVHYQAKNLCDESKKKITEKIQRHADWCEKEFQIPRSGFESVLSFLNQKSPDRSLLLAKFIGLTKHLDRIRGENTFEVFPELAESIHWLVTGKDVF